MKLKRYAVLFLVFVVAVSFWGCGKSEGDAGQSPAKDEKKSEDVKTTDEAKETKKRGGKPGKDGEEGEEKEPDAVPVQVIQPHRGDISSFLLFSSNVDSEKMVDIYPLTNGIIEKINRDEGDQVKRGTVLAILDDREASINEEKAKLNYQQLQREFERIKELFERQMVSKEAYGRFNFNLDTARLDWKQKKLLLSYTRITSPIDGVVTKRHIKLGNKINISQLTFSVVQIKEKIAVVNIPEQEVESIFLKQKAVISTANYEVKGYIKRRSPAIDPESGTFKVTVAVQDEENRLAVGQFVNVKIIKKVHKNAVLLAKDALIFEGGMTFVFVVKEDDKVVKKQIQIGFDDGSQVEVLKALTENDRVVTAGKSSLKTDTLVKIVEPITS